MFLIYTFYIFCHLSLNTLFSVFEQMACAIQITVNRVSCEHCPFFSAVQSQVNLLVPAFCLVAATGVVSPEMPKMAC